MIVPDGDATTGGFTDGVAAHRGRHADRAARRSPTCSCASTATTARADHDHRERRRLRRSRVHDARRVEFIHDHLAALHDAIEQGVPVIGYCHWSLLDNFEWKLGYAQRFGLVHVDYDDAGADAQGQRPLLRPHRAANELVPPVNVLLVMADQLVPFLTGTYGHPRRRDAGARPARRGRDPLRRGLHAVPALLAGAGGAPDRPLRVAARLLRQRLDPARRRADDRAPPDERRLRERAQRQDALRRARPAARLPAPADDRRLSRRAWTGCRRRIPEGRFVRGGHARRVRPAEGRRAHLDEVPRLRRGDALPRARVPARARARAARGAVLPRRVVPPSARPVPADAGALGRLRRRRVRAARARRARTTRRWTSGRTRRTRPTRSTSTRPENLQALRRAYAALVTYVDRKLGELLDALEQTGQADDTLVVFTSDHGDMLGERADGAEAHVLRVVGARAARRAAARTASSAGTTVARPVSLLDLAPTLLDLAGVPTRARCRWTATSLFDDRAAPSSPSTTSRRCARRASWCARAGSR